VSTKPILRPFPLPLPLPLPPKPPMKPEPAPVSCSHGSRQKSTPLMQTGSPCEHPVFGQAGRPMVPQLLLLGGLGLLGGLFPGGFAGGVDGFVGLLGGMQNWRFPTLTVTRPESQGFLPSHATVPSLPQITHSPRTQRRSEARHLSPGQQSAVSKRPQVFPGGPGAPGFPGFPGFPGCPGRPGCPGCPG